MIATKLELVAIEGLKEHEEFEPARLKRILDALEAGGFMGKAIAADERTMVVLDGVHRLNALRLAGCKVAPVCLVDYMSDDIVVYSMDRKRAIRKEEVLEAALSGRKFPPKTTWHMVRTEDGRLEHISSVEQKVHFALDRLAAGSAGRRSG